MRKKLKILMISPTPFFADRGCHIRILEEALVLKKKGHKVTILTYHIGRNIKGLDIVRIPPIFFWYKKLEAGPSWWKPFMDILMIFKTVSLLNKKKFDIIHSHLHEGALVGILGRFFSKVKIPILFDYQGSLTAEIIAHQFIQKSKFLVPIFRFIEKEIDNYSDYIITSSTAATDILIKNFKIIPEKVKVFLDQVNTDRFKPQPKDKILLKSLKLSKDDFIIGYLGLLTEYQGVDLFLNSIKILNESFMKNNKVSLKFLVMGYPNVEKYKQLSRDLNIEKHTIFTGRMPYGKIKKYLNLFDVAVSPKLVSSESNGKLLNYIACGLPVVAFDTVTNREILGDAGLFVKKISSKAFAKEIIKIHKNLKLRKTLKEKARKRSISYYSWDNFLKRLLEVYYGLLNYDKNY